MPSSPSPLRVAFLDVDGTLLDSNDAHAHAWVDAFDEAGHDIPFARIRPLIGKGGEKLLQDVSGISPESEEGEQILDRATDIFRSRYLAACQPKPGARALLERMDADGLRLFVVTAAESDVLEELLQATGVEDLIEDATSSGDVERSKPDPDIVQAALEKSGAARGEVLMLGDTPYDLEAATAAGVSFVGVRCGGWDDEAFAGAVAVYDDPADLLDRYEDSPYAR